jgi:hypothetical protein
MSITSDIFVFGDRLWLGQPILAQATASTVRSDESLPPLRFVSSILEKLAYIVFYLFQSRQIAYYIRQGTESTEDAWFWAATRWVLVYAFACAIFYAFTSISHYCLGFIERIIVSPISKWAPDALTRASKSLESFTDLIKVLYAMVYRAVYFSSFCNRAPLKLRDFPKANKAIREKTHRGQGIQQHCYMAAYIGK